MTIGQKIFYLLEQKNMTQKEFSDRTGIATTTISDWRKKNTNPGSDKIMAICAALGVTPEYLLSGVTEDSCRGREMDYMVLPRGTEERELIEMFNDMDWLDRAHLIDYARKLEEKRAEQRQPNLDGGESKVRIADFDDVEVYIDSSFEGQPVLDVYYIDEDVLGTIDMLTGTIKGGFSKYVKPVIEAWYEDYKHFLIAMWNSKKIMKLDAWD
ncbi:helix-turn-helix domain-containing protein [Butyrivibrio sp. WCD2001]|uniref:helix-turn-helix domain-containing protein n=1 Tax=Butyrivibrio sp. WCD2001 TaxID=1280681 RepID=UPI0004180A22|nr:helix-turn-helix transcriptional regulator [Butyrivibrio sp. WCD2001]